MQIRKLTMLLGCVTGVLLSLPAPADAQIWRKVKEKVKDEVEKRAEERATDGVRAGLNAAEDAIVCVVTDRECIAAAQQDGRAVTLEDEAGNTILRGAAAADAARASARPGEGAWANYDFVPGDRVLFVEDFARDRIGNFPQRLKFDTGNLELVEWEEEPYLRSTAESAFTIPLPERLPQRFTIEFDLHLAAWPASVIVISEPQRRMYDVSMYAGGTRIRFDRRSGILGSAQDRDLPEAVTETSHIYEREVPVRIMVDGDYAKVFVHEQRIANVPNTRIVRTGAIQVWIRGEPDRPAHIRNIRVAAGGRQLYDALLEEGRVATQGIYFDTGSDRIRPESTATLAEIAAMLREHPDLRLTIEGHTDNVGDDAVNQTLSERRAAAVAAALVEIHDIAADRLATAGLGETRPVAPNDSAEGRQQNRRVELVRVQ